MQKLHAAFALLGLISAPVRAAPQTVTLSVPGMTCAACPITVKQALSRVDGVTKTEVRFETREMVVAFDDQKTNIQALTEATKSAGYLSTPVKAVTR
jgi:periplasmic mercuric ion binding protein